MSEIAQSYLFSELNSDQERASEQSLGQRNSRKQQWELAMAKELQEGVEVINAEGGQVSLINSSEFAHLATTDGSVNVAKTEAVKIEHVVSPPNQSSENVISTPKLSLQNNLIKDQMISFSAGRLSSIRSVDNVSKTDSPQMSLLRSMAASQLNLNAQNVLVTRNGNMASIWIRQIDLPVAIVKEISKSLQEDFQTQGYQLTSIGLNGVVVWEQTAENKSQPRDMGSSQSHIDRII